MNPNPSSSAGPLRIGAIGAGGFGLFALQQFLQTPHVELAAIAGTHREAALAMSLRFGVADLVETETLLADPTVDLIYIATPPFLHYPQALAALQAGKHVICEKPLAMNVAQADELIALARSKNLLCVANLMQRYNPLFDAVSGVVQTGVLGECLHGWFENYASDEGLAADHWFWDREKSGGIFVEHGVHFFDLFEGWLGVGEVVAAQRTLRPGSEIGVEEQVQCTVRHASGPLVNFYHGFTQPSRLDRQEFRLLFEHGDLTLEEWVPTRARVRGAVNEAQTRQLMELFPGARLDVLKTFGGRDRVARGRHKDLDISQQIDLRHDGGGEGDKMRLYCQLLRSLFADQLAWLKDRNHPRKITEQNGRDSVAMAEAATNLSLCSL
ncbi:Gfo/Idh/MocA family oxidoreductase [Phragmitibacter flavus]|uniref:Gfo/Idh/MocA family oxidoreductase n=1 Tax=Phragmitibacter flavus TaxID=2576071 RepID=A0A5R8KAQ3_9BACT|nr:Gfo/Idh/MocA family oxidoreductase [Phragmitibacter flavus]TLD69390.1 Gfo/Idh/MocA family oxidoreductase [Phragmitibacter flavus]